MPLTTETAALLRAAPPDSEPGFATFSSTESAAYLRQLRDSYPLPAVSTEPDCQIEEKTLAGVPVRTYDDPASRGAERPGIIFLHGGGWVSGSTAPYDRLCDGLATELGAYVVGVDYRLAPEHPFPAGLEDALAVATWLIENGASIGVDSSRLAVVGVSAGGNLAAALAARGAEIPLAMQVLLYPVLDHTMSTDSYSRCATGYKTTAPQMAWFWDQYIPDPATRSHRDASPLHRPDHDSLPPSVIVAAEFDPLHDEAVLYARSLEDAGVPVTFAEGHGEIHGFLSLFPDGAGTNAVLAEVRRALGAVL